MTTIQKIILGIVAVAVIILAFFTFVYKGGALGDATVSNFPTWYYNGIVIGSTNSLLTNIISGSCNLAGSGSVADRATTSTTCAVPTAKVGDKVYMTQKTVGGTGSYPIVAASVTATGIVTAVLQNQTGGAAAPTTGAITGVSYLVIR